MSAMSSGALPDAGHWITPARRSIIGPIGIENRVHGITSVWSFVHDKSQVDLSTRPSCCRPGNAATSFVSLVDASYT
jgi:hypothetical protein